MVGQPNLPHSPGVAASRLTVSCIIAWHNTSQQVVGEAGSFQSRSTIQPIFAIAVLADRNAATMFPSRQAMLAPLLLYDCCVLRFSFGHDGFFSVRPALFSRVCFQQHNCGVICVVRHTTSSRDDDSRNAYQVPYTGWGFFRM